jgi:hypothetical protein
VLHRLEPSQLSVLCLVNKKLHRLATDDKLFRMHYNRRKERAAPPEFPSSALTWKVLYRNLCAMSRCRPSRVASDQYLSWPQPVSLLAVVPPLCAVFFQQATDLILGWPRAWARSRLEVCSSSPEKLAAGAVNIGTGEIAFVSEDFAIVTCLDAETGFTVRVLTLPVAIFPLSWTWTEGGMQRPLVCVRGGLRSDLLIFCGRNGDLHVVSNASGVLLRTWKASDSASARSPFSRLVRAPCVATGDSFTAIGITDTVPAPNAIDLDLRDIEHGSNLFSCNRLRLELSPTDELLDVVANVALVGVWSVACRVVTRLGVGDVSVSVVVWVWSDELWRPVLREALYRSSGNDTPVQASDTLVCLPCGTGFMVASARKISVAINASIGGDFYVCHTLVRKTGDSFRWTHVSDGSLLFVCSSNDVTLFDIGGAGRRICCLRSTGMIEDAFVLSNHALIVLTTSPSRSIDLFHFDGLCRAPFPKCCSGKHLSSLTTS